MWPVISSQVVFQSPAAAGTAGRDEGLRNRKKLRTRLAIVDAALALFADQGYEATTIEQIAERAEVSTTTFFRYFPTKGDVVLGDHGTRLPALRDAIVAAPPEVSEMAAVREALLSAWVPAIDPERTLLTARAVSTSHVLRGLSFDVGVGWLKVVASALARRRGLRRADVRSELAARTAMGVFGSAIESWTAHGCRGDLGEVLERRFDVMHELQRSCVEPDRPG